MNPYPKWMIELSQVYITAFLNIVRPPPYYAGNGLLTLEKYEKMDLYFCGLIGLCFSDWRNLKRPAFRFHLDGNNLKRKLFEKDDIPMIRRETFVFKLFQRSVFGCSLNERVNFVKMRR